MKKVELVRNEIFKRILTGSYTPGYRLVESQFAQEFNVSGVTARSAINDLIDGGYATRIKHVGAQVSDYDTTFIEQQVETTALLECLVVEMALPYIDTNSILRLRSINQELANSLEGSTAKALAALNHKFHAELAKKCPNRHLVSCWDREASEIRLILEVAYEQSPEITKRSIADHEHLIDLLENNPGDINFEEEIRAHRMRSIEVVREVASKHS